MTIRVKNGEGFPIIDKPAPALENKDADKSAPDPPLTVPYFHQIGDLLCWAACAKMVLRFHQFNSVRQCDVVHVKLNGENCCERLTQGIDSFLARCNEGVIAEEVSPIYKDGFKVNSKFENSPFEFEDLVEEVRKRPVQVAIKWTATNKSGGHMIVVRGCSVEPGERWVHVSDPLPDVREGIVRFEKLKDAYLEDGKWVHTWSEIAKIKSER